MCNFQSLSTFSGSSLRAPRLACAVGAVAVAQVAIGKYELETVLTEATALDYEQISRRPLGFNRFLCFAWPASCSRREV